MKRYVYAFSLILLFSFNRPFIGFDEGTCFVEDSPDGIGTTGGAGYSGKCVKFHSRTFHFFGIKIFKDEGWDGGDCSELSC